MFKYRTTYILRVFLLSLCGSGASSILSTPPQIVLRYSAPCFGEDTHSPYFPSCFQPKIQHNDFLLNDQEHEVPMALVLRLVLSPRRKALANVRSAVRKSSLNSLNSVKQVLHLILVAPQLCPSLVDTRFDDSDFVPNMLRLRFAFRSGVGCLTHSGHHGGGTFPRGLPSDGIEPPRDWRVDRLVVIEHLPRVGLVVLAPCDNQLPVVFA